MAAANAAAPGDSHVWNQGDGGGKWSSWGTAGETSGSDWGSQWGQPWAPPAAGGAGDAASDTAAAVLGSARPEDPAVAASGSSTPAAASPADPPLSHDPWTSSDPWASAARPLAGAAVRGRSEAPPRREERGAESNPWAAFRNPSATVRRTASVGAPLSRDIRLGPDFSRPRSWASERQATLLQEVSEELLKGGGPDASYVDGTYGRGGHSAELLRLLSPKGQLIAFDIDPTAVRAAQVVQNQDTRFRVHHRPHGDLLKVWDESCGVLAGVLLDLGTQVEDRRGYSSIVEDGPLDLRLNTAYGMPASEWLQTVSAPELAWVIYEYGEECDVILSMRLALAILERQQRLGPYRTASQLADVCREAKQGIDDRGQHPAKLTLQALRSFLNHEAEQLDLALGAAMELLKPGGRCVVITYKRKEAAQVKRFIREHEDADPRFAQIVTAQRLTELYPQTATDHPWACRQACEPIRPSQGEADRNPRARAASAWVLVKETRDPAGFPCQGLVRRSEGDQFRRPAPLPFQGAEEPEVVGLAEFLAGR